MRLFLQVCDLIKFPWAPEKTVWSTTRITFLGYLIDTVLQKIFIPLEKVNRAVEEINHLLKKQKSKATIREVQKLCGLLNFFSRCIIPGRTFTRRLYALQSNKSMLPHQHVRLRSENKMDLLLWKTFLSNQVAWTRDFADFTNSVTSESLYWYTDASRNPNLGMGGICQLKNGQMAWFWKQWNKEFIIDHQPSIGYLELYAVAVGIVLWTKFFRNRNIILYCDNLSVVNMLNNKTSKCPNCMILVRIIVLHSMLYNTKISAHHVRTENNSISDSLSRLKFRKFKFLTRHFNLQEQSTGIPECLWPLDKVWLKAKKDKN